MMMSTRYRAVLTTSLAMTSVVFLYSAYKNTVRSATEPPTISRPRTNENLQHSAPKLEAVPLTTSKPSWEREPNWDEFYAFIENTTRCDHLEMFGGQTASKDQLRDGEKAVCLDGGFALSPGKCLVLSFGINNEWSFDDAIAAHGCTVYAFDPTMNQQAHDRGKSIHFLPLGLGSKRENVTIGSKVFEVLSYRQILDKIGKTDSVVDYLKIDIEGFELNFFNNILYEDAKLLSNIKQIGMEIHMGTSATKRNEFWQYLHLLVHRHNFSPVASAANLVGANKFKHRNKTVSQCYEIVWANNKFRVT